MINFFDWPEDRAREYKDVFSIIESKVKPERQRLNSKGEYALRQPLPTRWWQHGDKRPALYHAVGRGERFDKHPKGWQDNMNRPAYILAVTLHTKFFTPFPVKNDCVLSHALAAFATFSKCFTTLLSSTQMQDWVWSKGSSIGQGLRFTPSDCYETFPFPLSPLPQLESLGEQFDAHRRKIMLLRQIGLTALYNFFHNPNEADAELEEMRRLQREIDVAVRDSYGWQDIDLAHGFHEVGYLPANDNVRYTISEPVRIEILKRLAALNRQQNNANPI